MSKFKPTQSCILEQCMTLAKISLHCILKGDSKLYFTHYLCVVIISFNLVLYKFVISTYFFVKFFSCLCVFYVLHLFYILNFYVIWIEFITFVEWSSLIYNTSARHEWSESDTSATWILHKRHKCNTSAARVKNFNFHNDASKNIFFTPLYLLYGKWKTTRRVTISF